LNQLPSIDNLLTSIEKDLMLYLYHLFESEEDLLTLPFKPSLSKYIFQIYSDEYNDSALLDFADLIEGFIHLNLVNDKENLIFKIFHDLQNKEYHLDQIDK
jgi:hypothetical protein